MAYKDYLNLSSRDISNLGDVELRNIINDLNDVANKRIKRLERSGLSLYSPAYSNIKASGNTRFRLERGEGDMTKLKSAYLKVRNFLSDETETSTIAGTRTYIEKLSPAIDKALNKAMQDERNLDKRYKTAKLKKTAERDTLNDFWDSYNEWREISMKNNPEAWKQGSPKEFVEYFYDEYYSKGKTNVTDYEEGTKKQYEESVPVEEGLSDEKEFPPTANERGRVDAPKRDKYTKTRKGVGGIKQRFQKIKVF